MLGFIRESSLYRTMTSKKKARSPTAQIPRGAKKPGFQLPQLDAAIVWHPEAHQRFQERLYYFFFKVRPLEHQKHLEALNTLMAQFGIKRYCSYSLLGGFDSLVRVWLPAPKLREFLDAAAQIIPHRSETQRFSVQKKPICWIEEEVGNPQAVHAAAAALSPSDVSAVQEKSDPAMLEKLWRAGLLRWRDHSMQPGEVKAFIAFFEPPDNLPEAAKEHLLKQVAERLRNRTRNPTLMEGAVYCWAMAKVICASYQTLCELLEELVKDLAPHLVSTRTFLVVSGFATHESGDSISKVAIDLKQQSDPVVAEILPEFYAEQNPPLDAESREAMVKWVRQHLIEHPLPDEEDALAIRRFFVAVARDSREDAFVALYPRFINAETRIAGPILPEFAKYIQGGGAAIAAGIQERGKDPPRLNKLTLAHSLQAARYVLSVLMPEDRRVKDLPTREFEQIGKIRNALMHGFDFQPRTEWKEYANSALALFAIRDSIASCYQKLRETRLTTASPQQTQS